MSWYIFDLLERARLSAQDMAKTIDTMDTTINDLRRRLNEAVKFHSDEYVNRVELEAQVKELEQRLAAALSQIESMPKFGNLLSDWDDQQRVEPDGSVSRLAYPGATCRVIERNPATGMPTGVRTEPYQEQEDDHDARDDYPDHTPHHDFPIQIQPMPPAAGPIFMLPPTPSPCDGCRYGPSTYCNAECWDGRIDQGGCMADWNAITVFVPGAYGMPVQKTYYTPELDRLFCEEYGEPVLTHIQNGTAWLFHNVWLYRINGEWEQE